MFPQTPSLGMGGELQGAPGCNSKGEVELCANRGVFTSGNLFPSLYKGDKNSPYLIGSGENSVG